MNKNRLEAFSDGVLAIIITIMILEIKVPEGENFSDLQLLFPKFISYILSFVYVGIYWNNHHHMLQSVTKVNGKILWANLHLLFWLSLIPVSTGWMGEHNFAKATLALYGFILLMAGISYVILQNFIIASQGENSLLKKAIGKDLKGKSSAALYIIAIVFSFFNEWVSGIIYIAVAMMWLIP
ncbi:TMEM175 family protein [Flavobacterium gawalongense]|uniref:TMEM175 family protein n=1 Tax=Flavobacterium gawalongense TaxID=2594432 RepID=UPI0029391C83|nr:TMEM175 family protein [Flavobacterium gawalongense]